MTLTATVAGAGPETPTGSVEFFDGATSLGTSALNGAAEATSPLVGLRRGDPLPHGCLPQGRNLQPDTSSPATLITIGKADQAALAVIATSPAAFGSSQTLSTSGGSGSGAVTYSDGSSTACSVSGSTLSITAGSGTCSVTATKAGDADYNPETSPAKLITIGKADQAALAVIATSPAAFGSSQTLSTSGGSGSGAVTYSDGSSTACSVSGSTLSITAGSGTCSVTATKAGDADYNPETSPAKLITIGKADQAALAVIATSPAAFGSSQTLSTSGGSGSGAVTYSDGSSTACSVSGSTLSITAGSGTCSVTATKAGDADYNPETSPAKLITIGKADQAALAVIATSPAAFGSSQTLSTSGGSGSGAVTYSDGSSTACSVSGSTLSITAGSGTCSVTATKAGDADYNPETSPAKLITIGKADQAALAVIATSPAAFGSSQTLSTSGGSGSGAVTYSDGSSTACSVSGSTLSITAGSGTCSVTATKAGDADYNPETSPAKLITIGKADQAALAVIATSPAAFGSSQTLSTSGGSGSGAVTYSDGSSTACSVSGSTLSITAGSGTCSVTATKAGDANYNPETSPAKLITIGKADQAALAVIATSPAAFGSSQTLSTSGGSGSGAVTYSDGSSTACSVSGSTLSITASSGTCSVTATKAADSNYNATTSAPFVVAINKADQATLRVTGPATRTYGDAPFAPTATGGSGTGAVTFTSSTPSICTASSSATVTIIAAGSCTITATKAADDNYNATTSAPFSVAIGKAAVTVTANNKTRQYGAEDPVFDATFTGLVGADDPGTPACATTPDAPKVVGSGYPITCTTGALATANYTYSFVPGTLTIARAHLTVTGVDATRQYGLPNPAFTAIVSGFVLGETAASAGVTGSAVCTTTADKSTGVGSAAITCTAGNLLATNYDFPTLISGTLSITPFLAAPALSVDANPSALSEPVTYKATVTWPTGTPTGTITFFEDGTDLSGPVALAAGVAPSTGTAQFTTSALPIGDHVITAAYSGDGANFGSATSNPFTQSVGTSAVNTTLGSNRAKWETSVPITFTATAVPAASRVTVPVTGTVAFRVDGTLKATVKVVAGKASYASPALKAGSHTVTATYSTDAPGAVYFTAGAAGTMTRTVVANTVSASSVSLSATSVYPYKDSWRDTVLVRGTRLEPLSVSIAVYSSKGTKVRSASYGRASGAYAWAWNGRTSSGRTLAAGRYKVVQTLADAYGARRSTRRT